MMCDYCYNILFSLLNRCPKCGEPMWFDPEVKKKVIEHQRRMKNVGNI